jgi:hypothetical protein
MGTKQTYIPDEKMMGILTPKQFYQRVKNRLESMGKSTAWLRLIAQERGLPTQFKDYTTAQRVTIFEIMEEHRHEQL